MNKDRFQAEHGARWAAITNEPAFMAAMQVAYETKLQAVAVLTPAEIQMHAVPILASLQGHLEHEIRLVELGVQEIDPTGLPEETYEASTDGDGAEPTVETRTISTGPFVDFQQEQATRPITRRRRKKRRRKRATKKVSSTTQPPQIIKTNLEG